MELRDYVRIFRRRWKSIALLVLLGLVAGLAFTLLSPKVYAAQSKVYVKLADVNPATAYQGNQYVLALMPSYAQLDGSPLVLGPVISKLGLHESVQQLASRVSISNPAATVYLDVDVMAGSSRKASRIADATGSQLANVIEGLQKSETSDRVVLGRAQAATTSSAPVSPKLSLDLALGLVLGLILGLISAIVRNRLDTSIRSAEDLHLLTGVPPLAYVPLQPEGDDGADEPRTRERLSAYRAFRTDLALASGGHLPTSVVVVASDSDDGPDVAVNLASVAARSGIKTCLVEADLRRPRLAAILSSRELTGLTAVLEGRAQLADAVFAWPGDDAHAPAVVVAGEAADDPADLLDSAAMARTHRTLAATFDLVVFSCPPADNGSDAVILARDSAAVVLVVRAGSSARSGFTTAAEALAAVGATVAGAVMVETPRGRSARRASRHAASAAEPTPLSTTRLGLVRLNEPSVPFAPSGTDVFVAPSNEQRHLGSAGSHRATATATASAPLPGASGPLPPRARSTRSRRTPRGVLVPGPVESADVESADVESADVEDGAGVVVGSGPPLAT